MKVRLSSALVLPFFIILGFVVYLPSLSAPFFFDDYEFVTNNPLARNAAVLFSQWPSAGLKFITYLTFVGNFIVGGEAPFGYHLLSIILHIFNAWLLSILAGKLLQTPQSEKHFNSQQKAMIPLMAALLFLVHPVASSAVSYIWQRAELLTAAFYLSALIFYVLGRQEKKIVYTIAAAVCFVVGLFAKGTILSLLLMIILFECAFWPVSRKKAYAIILSFGALFFLKAYLYLWEEPWAIYTKVVTLPLMQITGTVLSPEHVWTQFLVTVKYLGLAVFPLGQNFDYDIPLAVRFWEPRICLSAAALIGLIALAIFLWNKKRFLSVGIFWFLLCLLPSALLAGREPMWEYRMYMPLSGLVMGIVACAVQSFDRRKVLWTFIAIVVVFSGLTFNRNLLWQSPEKLLLDNIRKFPQSANSHQLLGTYYLQEGRIDEAEIYLEKTISLAPDAAESYNNLGLIAKNRGDLPKAQRMFEASIHYRPTLTSAYINLAYLILGQGDEEKAQVLLRQSLAVRETEGAYAALGKLSLLRGQLDEAQEFLDKSLAINPQASQAYFWYGELWTARGNPGRAKDMYREAIRFNPRLSGLVPMDD